MKHVDRIVFSSFFGFVITDSFLNHVIFALVVYFSWELAVRLLEDKYDA